MQTPRKSVKPLYPPNTFCRICRVNIKAYGRSCVNIFGPKCKNESVPERLSVVVDKEVLCMDGVSENICQKCYREFIKFEKHLEEKKRLLEFRSAYSNAVQAQVDDQKSEKRCAKDSPSPVSCRSEKKARLSSAKTNTTSRRMLFSKNDVSCPTVAAYPQPSVTSVKEKVMI